MARIEQRTLKDGRVRYKAILRRQGLPMKTKTFGTRLAAEAWAKRQEVLILDRRAKPMWEAERHTVADAIDRYLADHLEEDFPKIEYARDRRAHLEWWRGEIGDLTLAQLSPPAAIVEARQRLMRERGIAGSTANRYMAALSRVFKLAVTEWFWLEANPTRNIPRKKDSKPRVRFLSDAERKALLDACQESDDPRLHPLVLFAITTGARQGELLGLRWQDIDLVNLRATLHETKNRDRRTLHFPGTAGTVLREMARVPSFSGYVFAGPGGPGGKPPQMMLKPWADAVRAAGLEDFRFHDLRHTAASYLAMSGATLAELAAFLGHRSLEMVRRYAHLTDQHQLGVAKRMADKYLGDL